METEIRILMLEDSEDDAGLVEYQLRKDKMRFRLIRIDSRDEFINAFDSFKPDVVLSDHSLPQFNSLEALRICLEKKINIPFIMLTGAASEAFIASCLEQGADACILKSEMGKLGAIIKTALINRQGSK